MERVELANELGQFMGNNGENNRLCEEEIPSDARATLLLKQTHGQTWLSIIVNNARPHALFTVWVLLGTDAASPLPSPLTGAPATPMVRSDLVAALVPVTPRVGDPLVTVGLQSPPFQPGDGDTTVYMDNLGPTGPAFGTRSLVPNGFYTNRFGWGIFTTHLDFELVGGTYPFDQVEIPGRVVQGALSPVPIRPNLPFAIVSHCKDEKGHGLVFRANNATGDQPWFFYRP
jgi:hypothetical protein